MGHTCSQVDVRLQQAFEDFQTQTSVVLVAQQAVLEAVTQHQHKVGEVIQSSGGTGGSVETLAGEGRWGQWQLAKSV